MLHIGDVRLDTAAHAVEVAGRPVELNAQQFAILPPSCATPIGSSATTPSRAPLADGRGRSQRAAGRREPPSAATRHRPGRPLIVTEKAVGYRLISPAPTERVVKRSTLAWLIGLGGIALVTVVCYALGDHVDPTITALLLLVPIVAASVLGGLATLPRRVVHRRRHVRGGLPAADRPVQLGLTEDVFVLVTFEVRPSSSACSPDVASVATSPTTSCVPCPTTCAHR